MKHKALKVSIAAGLVSVTTLSVGAYYARRAETAPEVTFAPVTRGSIVSVIVATGTLEAVTTVQVGTQVSGAIQTLYADYNSIVRKGQVLARLDSSLYQSTVEQARASLIRAEAELDRLKVTLADTEVKLQRAQELAARQLIPANELDTAHVNRQSAEAQVKSSAAGVTQARAALRQAEVNLSKTVITSPIDGIVIARNVDIGQTVAASLQAPTLFVIAADLSQMQLKANVDEADLGRIAAGQTVSFTVDAYPNHFFTGRVEQVRLNPVVEQNVVTYAAIISAPNPELKLKPGMTASLTVEVARRDNVLRAPNAALRFQPTADMLRAFDADVPVRARDTSVWQYVNGQLKPVRVTAGATDGTYTELVGEPLAEGTRVVTRVSLGTETSAVASRPASSPLMPPGQPRR